MSESINDITIVGGGDSGLLTGLIVQKLNPGVDISVVDDFQRDIPQVGKSTYLAIRYILHDIVGIDEKRFVSEVKPIWKATVFFRDWCDRPPFHYPFDVSTAFPPANTPDAIENLYYYYDDTYNSPDHLTKCGEIAEQRRSPWNYSPTHGGYQKYNEVAYHLNTERFNSFLRDLCRERGISLIDDEITGVDTTGNRIQRIRSKRQSYEADLYVDASGFERVLKRELDGEFVEFEFPLDAAFTTRVERPLSEVVPATVVDSGKAGWFWQIDTFDNRDLGYVYASDFASDDEARAEFIDHCGGDVSAEDVAKYSFTSGYYDPAWEENCIAIGNAEGFVEPLQSTGLTANAQAAVKLSNLLSFHGRINKAGTRETYNSWVRQSWESIADFISVHYKFSAGDTEFWEAMRSLAVSPRVEHLVREFDRNGFNANVDPTRTDAEIDDLLIFNPRNFYVIMRCMGATSEYYETNEFEVSDEVKHDVDESHRERRNDVSSYLTTREFYNSAFDL